MTVHHDPLLSGEPGVGGRVGSHPAWRKPIPLPAACRILIKMANAFFSSSWRILEPYGRAVQRLAQKGRRSTQPKTPGVQSVELSGPRRSLLSRADTNGCCAAVKALVLQQVDGYSSYLCSLDLAGGQRMPHYSDGDVLTAVLFGLGRSTGKNPGRPCPAIPVNTTSVDSG
jgi:hypothetical protein